MYFESSGHGSLYVSPSSLPALEAIPVKSPSVELLLCLFQLSNNNPKGDAFRNYLVFELCQCYLGLSNGQLCSNYKTFNKVSVKVPAKQKHQMVITKDEKTVLSPEGVARVVHRLKTENADCEVIVRASATEDVVRINVQSLRPREELLSIAQAIEEAVRGCPELN